MTIQDYRRAVDAFAPDVYLKRRVAARLAREERERRARPRRVLARALMIAAVLACLVTAAFAVSPKLRQMVISLFWIQEAEPVPPASQLPTPSDPVTSIVLGDKVQVQYIHVEDGNLRAEGELLVNEHRQDGETAFYALEGDSLIGVGQDAREVTVEFQTENGLPAKGWFRWFAYNGRVYLADLMDRPSQYGFSGHWLQPSALPGRTDVILLESFAVQGSRAWFYHLESGELEDILAGCGTEEYGVAWDQPGALSEDLRYVLVNLGDADGGCAGAQLYLVDRQAGTCTAMSQLTGLDLPPYQGLNADRSQGCWFWFQGGDSVFLQISRLEGEEQVVEEWVYHIPSGTVTPAPEETREVLMESGKDGMLKLIREGEALWMVNDATGQRARLEDFPFQVPTQPLVQFPQTKEEWEQHMKWERTQCSFSCNDAGTRLLCAGTLEDGTQQIGVIDLEYGTFRLLERARDDQEPSIDRFSWLGDDRVLGGYVEIDGENCLCVYDFTYGQTGPAASQGEVGGLVQAVYVQTDGLNYDVGNGVFYRAEHDPEGEITQVRFWGVDGGALIPLEGEACAFDLTWEGVRYQGSFRWCVRQGQLTCVGRSDRDDRSWGVSAIPGRTDAVFLTLGQGSQLSYRSQVYLYYLDTGAVTDLLAEVPREVLAQAADYTWSEDLNGVILGCADRERQTNTLWYCDLEAGMQTRLGTAGGAQGELRAWFADGETVLLARRENGQEAYELWLWNLETGEQAQAEYDTRGLELLGEGRYAIRRDEGGAVCVVDLITGAETEVEGGSWRDGGQFIPRGDRLLYVRRGGDGEPGIAQLGMLDLKAGTFLGFDRVGQESWDSAQWFDDDTVVVRTLNQENLALGIYLYTF